MKESFRSHISTTTPLLILVLTCDAALKTKKLIRNISTLLTNQFGAAMNFPSMITVRPLLLASAFCLGSGALHAQVTPGPGGSIVGQPPAQGSSGQSGPIIGQPPVGQSGSMPGQAVPRQTAPITPGQPGTGSTIGYDPVRDKLDRMKRDAADIDRDGRISPEEASRMPSGNLVPR